MARSTGRGYNTIKQTLPPLIAEEDEYDTSFSSINTDMYSNIVQDEIIVSPIPPDPPRPRIVQRMMLDRERDTMIPWSNYTNTDRITRKSIHQENTHEIKAKRRKLMQKELCFPSIAFGIDGKESAFSVLDEEKYRFYFFHQYSKEVSNTNICALFF